MDGARAVWTRVGAPTNKRSRLGPGAAGGAATVGLLCERRKKKARKNDMSVPLNTCLMDRKR